MHDTDVRLENRILFQDPRPGALGSLGLAGTITASRGVSDRPMRVLGSYALVLVLSGGGGYRDRTGLRETVRPGDAILLFPELPHAYGPRLLDGSARPTWDELYVLFSGPAFDLLRTGGVLDSRRPVVAPPPDWGARLGAFVRAHTPPTSSVAALAFASLLCDLVSAAPSENASWKDAAQAALARDLQEPLDLEALAAAFDQSGDAFRKRFGRETGTTPSRYRAARRMEAADALLRETRMPLRAIAEALGFVDEFHLSHAYKRARGVPPSSVRKGEAVASQERGSR